MAFDALLALQAQTTKTTGFSSTGLDLKEGTPRRGLAARVRVTTLSGTSPTVTFTVQHSDDNNTYYDLAHFDVPTLTAAGNTSCTFETEKRYVRLVSVIEGTSMSVVYDGYIGNAKR